MSKSNSLSKGKANRAQGLSAVDNLEATIGISALSPQSALRQNGETRSVNEAT